MKIVERYASAVNSHCLKSEPDTTWSDTDVLGAYAIADRRLSEGHKRWRKPLAVPLQRLFTGDNSVAREIVEMMAEIALGLARSRRIELGVVEARDMAKIVLAWFRSPACRTCHGHGFAITPNTPVVSELECPTCNGTGKFPIVEKFKKHGWVVEQLIIRVESEASVAGPAAMDALSLTIDN